MTRCQNGQFNKKSHKPEDLLHKEREPRARDHEFRAGCKEICARFLFFLKKKKKSVKGLSNNGQRKGRGIHYKCEDHIILL